jgi:predicted ester cyclase
MKQLIGPTSILTLALVVAFGCKKEDKAPVPDQAPAAGKTTTPAVEEPAAAWTGADSAKAFIACREAFNANEGKALRECLAEDASVTMLDFVGPDMKMEGREAVAGMLDGFRSGFPDVTSTPQLVLADGNKVAAIVLDTGTNSGEMMGQPPTNKKTSSLAATLTWFNDKGQVVRDVSLADQATMAHQLGLHKSETAPASETPWKETVTAVAKPEDEEKIGTNVELVKNSFDAIQKKDIDALMAHVAADVTFRYVPHKDQIEGKAAYRKGIEEYVGMVATSSRNIEQIWGAGDWVVAWSKVENELAADVPGAKGSKGKKVTTQPIEFFRLGDGKVKEHWVFENSMKWAVQVGLIDAPTAAE